MEKNRICYFEKISSVSSACVLLCVTQNFDFLEMHRNKSLTDPCNKRLRYKSIVSMSSNILQTENFFI